MGRLFVCLESNGLGRSSDRSNTGRAVPFLQFRSSRDAHCQFVFLFFSLSCFRYRGLDYQHWSCEVDGVGLHAVNVALGAAAVASSTIDPVEHGRGCSLVRLFSVSLGLFFHSMYFSCFHFLRFVLLYTWFCICLLGTLGVWFVFGFAFAHCLLVMIGMILFCLGCFCWWFADFV